MILVVREASTNQNLELFVGEIQSAPEGLLWLGSKTHLITGNFFERALYSIRNSISS